MGTQKCVSFTKFCSHKQWIPPIQAHNYTLKNWGRDFPNFKILQMKGFSGLWTHWWKYKYATLLISSQEKLTVIRKDENSAAEMDKNLHVTDGMPRNECHDLAGVANNRFFRLVLFTLGTCLFKAVTRVTDHPSFPTTDPATALKVTCGEGISSRQTRKPSDPSYDNHYNRT